jgi:hypothetical protein
LVAGQTVVYVVVVSVITVYGIKCVVVAYFRVDFDVVVAQVALLTVAVFGVEL